MQGFWDSAARAGPNIESPDEPLTIAFPAEPAPVNMAEQAFQLFCYNWF